MNPITAISLLNGAVQLALELAPIVDQYAKDGQITPEDQAAVKAKLDALRSTTAFEAPEWKKASE